MKADVAEAAATFSEFEKRRNKKSKRKDNFKFNGGMTTKHVRIQESQRDRKEKRDRSEQKKNQKTKKTVTNGPTKSRKK